MLKELLMQTYVIILPIVLGYIVWLLKTQTAKKQKAEQQNETIARASEKGIMLLLRIQLIEYHEKYIERESIPSYAYQNFEEMYNTYHELGGNGMVTKMFDEIKALPIEQKGGHENEERD